MLDDIIREYKDYSMALTGCRAQGINYNCCEYDLIILGAEERIININDEYIEVHRLSNNKIQMTLQLYNSKIIQDPSLRLVALKQSIDPHMLRRDAKRKLIDVLFDASSAKNGSNLLEASFLLKRAAYLYLNAILELNLIKPAPLHLLSQLKNMDIDLTLALECLGTRDANSSSITRASSILHKLLDSRLVDKKISYLYDNHKYVDCYLYITHLALTLNKDYHNIIDDLRILLNLDTDQELIKKLGAELIKECKLFLRNINH